ncbi:MAG: IS256 family transposase, partial [Collinsella aerofaciens]
SFPSRESMLRLTCASLMETEGQWSQQRVFSEASAAEGFAAPADRPAPTEGRRRALGRRAREIVDELVEKRGLKKE